MELPPIVSDEEWQRSHEALLAKEKAATRARDALAAERRRQPMTEFSPDYGFEGPDGDVRLARPLRGPQPAARLPLLVPARRRAVRRLHDVRRPGRPARPHATRATPRSSLVSHARRSGDRRATSGAWAGRSPGTRVVGTDFQEACGTTEYFKLDVFLRDGDRVFLTYATTGRGVEALGSVWTFLDLTPFGRQEEWEDTPAGRPQTPPYEWWRKHDEYEASA